MTDGTSERELYKAMSSFLNCTGAGDYNLPNLMATNQTSMSQKKNQPAYSFRERPKKLPWFPNLHRDFVGQASPPPTKYNP